MDVDDKPICEQPLNAKEKESRLPYSLEDPEKKASIDISKYEEGLKVATKAQPADPTDKAEVVSDDEADVDWVCLLKYRRSVILLRECIYIYVY